MSQQDQHVDQEYMENAEPADAIAIEPKHPKKRGRKPLPNSAERRKEQNKAAQKTFREKKMRYLKNLEVRAESADDERAKFHRVISQLVDENNDLRTQLGRPAAPLEERMQGKDLGSLWEDFHEDVNPSTSERRHRKASHRSDSASDATNNSGSAVTSPDIAHSSNSSGYSGYLPTTEPLLHDEEIPPTQSYSNNSIAAVTKPDYIPMPTVPDFTQHPYANPAPFVPSIPSNYSLPQSAPTQQQFQQQPYPFNSFQSPYGIPSNLTPSSELRNWLTDSATLTPVAQYRVDQSSTQQPNR